MVHCDLITIYIAVLEECHNNHWGWGKSVRMADITGQDGKDWFSSTTSLHAKVAGYVICRRRLSSPIASMEIQLILLLAVSNGNYRSVSYVCLFRGQFKLEKQFQEQDNWLLLIKHFEIDHQTRTYQFHNSFWL